MKKIILSVLLMTFSGNVLATGWQLRQVKIDHIQAGNDEYIFASFSGDTDTLSDCTGTWGADWAAIPLSNMTEKTKYMISFAMSAQASGTLVDIGGTKGDCLPNKGDLPVITFIRVGDYLK